MTPMVDINRQLRYASRVMGAAVMSHGSIDGCTPRNRRHVIHNLVNIYTRPFSIFYLN